MTSLVCSHTNEEMSACASSNNFAHSIAASQVPIGVAIFSQNSLVCGHSVSTVPGIIRPLKVPVSISVPVLSDSENSVVGRIVISILVDLLVSATSNI